MWRLGIGEYKVCNAEGRMSSVKSGESSVKCRLCGVDSVESKV